MHLFALQEEGRTVRQRLRLSDELKRKYVLHLRPPETESFAVTSRVECFYDEDIELMLLDNHQDQPRARFRY